MPSILVIQLFFLLTSTEFQEPTRIQAPDRLLGHYQFAWYPQQSYDRMKQAFPDFIQFDIVDPDSTGDPSSFKVVAYFFPSTKADDRPEWTCQCRRYEITGDSISFSTLDCKPDKYEFRGSVNIQGVTSDHGRYSFDGIFYHYRTNRLVKKSRVQFAWIEGC
jgi:hypothetical protein